MTQRKINSFFNSSMSGNRPLSQQNNLPMYQTNLNPAPTKSMHWSTQMYRPNPALQRYHKSRKVQKAKQTKEKSCFGGIEGGSEFSTPSNSQAFTQNSQVLEDSISFPNSYSSEDSQSWSQRNFNAGNSFFSSSNRPSNVGPYAKYPSDVKPFTDIQVKQEIKQYMEIAKQQVKERDERFNREMLENFLMSAKQCCEEANEIAGKVSEKLDETQSNIILKMKEHLENTLPQIELMQMVIQRKHEVEEMLQKELAEIKAELKQTGDLHTAKEKKMLEEIANTREQYLKHVTIAINESNQSQEEILNEIRESLKKPKKTSCDMWSQYSPQNQGDSLQRQYTQKHTVQNKKDFDSIRFSKTFLRTTPSPIATVYPFHRSVTTFASPQNRQTTTTRFPTDLISYSNAESNRADEVHSSTESPGAIKNGLCSSVKQNTTSTFSKVCKTESKNDSSFDSVKEWVDSMCGDENEEASNVRYKKPPKRKRKKRAAMDNLTTTKLVSPLQVHGGSSGYNIYDAQKDHRKLAKSQRGMFDGDIMDHKPAVREKTKMLLNFSSDSDGYDDIFSFTNAKHCNLKLC